MDGMEEVREAFICIPPKHRTNLYDYCVSPNGTRDLERFLDHMSKWWLQRQSLCDQLGYGSFIQTGAYGIYGM